MSRSCSNCEYTTGLMLMSYPPKVKCTLDNKYHFYTDECTVEFAPVRHGHWIRNDNGTYSCSKCQSWIPNEQHYYARYCLFCGARMDEVEEILEMPAGDGSTILAEYLYGLSKDKGDTNDE